jgi:hypothetical protein
MTGAREYCLADKPNPVSARAMRTLQMVADLSPPVHTAPRQIERLRRSGYVQVHHSPGSIVTGWPPHDYATITQAGLVLLRDNPPAPPAKRPWIGPIGALILLGVVASAMAIAERL